MAAPPPLDAEHGTVAGQLHGVDQLSSGSSSEDAESKTVAGSPPDIDPEFVAPPPLPVAFEPPPLLAPSPSKRSCDNHAHVVVAPSVRGLSGRDDDVAYGPLVRRRESPMLSAAVATADAKSVVLEKIQATFESLKTGGRRLIERFDVSSSAVKLAVLFGP
ncbi:MAG: hypothetical protein AAGK78_14365, partial [Planctomycetota bacterium]